MRRKKAATQSLLLCCDVYKFVYIVYVFICLGVTQTLATSSLVSLKATLLVCKATLLVLNLTHLVLKATLFLFKATLLVCKATLLVLKVTLLVSNNFIS